MSTTGLITFDKMLQVTNLWLNDLSAELGWDDKHKSLQVLRATLHTLRDRLSVEQASKLSSQLPLLLVGFFYEDWNPVSMPHKERSKEAFLLHIDAQFDQLDLEVDAEQAVRAVFALIAKRISPGEVKDIESMMPKALKLLWPQMSTV